jgi:hypothetical protein
LFLSNKIKQKEENLSMSNIKVLSFIALFAIAWNVIFYYFARSEANVGSESVDRKTHN